MPDQNRRTILSRQHPLGRSDRFRKGRQRVLHGRHVKACRLQSGNHLGPARAIGKQAVHEYDVARLRWHGRRRRHPSCGDQGSRGTGGQKSRKSASVHQHESFSIVARVNENVRLGGVGRTVLIELGMFYPASSVTFQSALWCERPS